MITVETGTCVVGANSYSTLEEFKTFLNAMLLNEANYTDAQLEALLISGHVALHLKYAPALLSTKVCTAISVLDFPRNSLSFLDFSGGSGYNVLLSVGGVPVRVKEAAMWLAFMETKISFKQISDTAKKVKIDGLLEVEFTGGSSGVLEEEIGRLVDSLMSPFIVQGGGNFVPLRSIIGM